MVGTLTGPTRHVLLAGGGHAHAVALRQLASNRPDPSLRITLVSPSTQNMYSGALAGVIAGHWDADAIGVNLLALCSAAGATFVKDRILTLDPERRTVRLASGETLVFDLLSLDIGSAIRSLDIEAPDGIVVPIRPIGAFLERWAAALHDIQGGERPARMIIAGAGLAGVEVALAVQYRLKAMFGADAETLLIDTGSEIAGDSHPALRTRLTQALQRAGIPVLTETRILPCKAEVALLSNGTSQESALVINCSGSAPYAWLPETGLETINGRIAVDACLRSTSHPHILAAGDTAWFTPEPVAPAGVYAIRAGPVIAENICRYAQNRPAKAFHPQKDYLKLISLGGKCAVAEKFGITLEGNWAWHLKKYIDFSFLRAHSPTASD